MSDDDPASRRRNRAAVTRSYASENKALDALADKTEQDALARRRAREQARKLRLEQRLRQHEEEQKKLQDKQSAKEEEEYREALEEAKKRVEERRERAVKSDEDASEKLLAETDELTSQIDIPVENEVAISLLQQVKKLHSSLKDTILNYNRMLNYKVKAGFELDKLRDRNEELEEENRSLVLKLKGFKDQVTDFKHQVSTRDTTIAELQAASTELSEAQDTSKSDDGGASSQELAELQEQNDQLRKELDLLKSSLSPDTDESDLELHVNDELDPVVAARIRRLENQVKRYKRQVKDAEEEQEELRKDNKKLQSDMRGAIDARTQMEVKLEAVQNQLTRLREKRRREIIDSTKSSNRISAIDSLDS